MPWLAHPWSLSFTPVLSLVYALFLTKLLSIPKEQPKLWQDHPPIDGFAVFAAAAGRCTTVYRPSDHQCRPVLCAGCLTGFSYGHFTNYCHHPQPQQVETIFTGRRNQPLPDCPFSLHGFFVKNNASPQVQAIINYPPFYMALGLFIELFCFLLALAYRNKLVEVEKNSLQQHYTSQLETELSKRTTK
jgi:hypothetical protein